MTLKPLEDFKSLMTHHCVTGSIRHIYAHNDHDISEDMLLGIGAGVSFSYWHFKGQPPFVGGRGNFERPGVEGLEKTTGKRTGVTCLQGGLPLSVNTDCRNNRDVRTVAAQLFCFLSFPLLI